MSRTSLCRPAFLFHQLSPCGSISEASRLIHARQGHRLFGIPPCYLLQREYAIRNPHEFNHSANAGLGITAMTDLCPLHAG